MPDLLLGDVTDQDETALRRHLRGCGGCRRELAALEEGLAIFSRAAHTMRPPPELQDRVLDALEDEWRASPSRPTTARPGRRALAPFAVAASLVLALGGAAWGFGAQRHAANLSTDLARYEDAHDRYRAFLGALGGKDVRVGTLRSTSTLMRGSVVVYDGDEGQSWVLVLVRGAESSWKLRARLSGRGRSVDVGDVRVDGDGDGSGWLVTRADLTSLDTVHLVTRTGSNVASGAIR